MKKITLLCGQPIDGYPCRMRQTAEVEQQVYGTATIVMTCIYGHKTYFPLGKIGVGSALQEWLNNGEVF